MTKKIVVEDTKKEEVKTYTGVVLKEFKIRKKVFKIADDFITKCKITYDILINAKRIK